MTKITSYSNVYRENSRLLKPFISIIVTILTGVVSVKFCLSKIPFLPQVNRYQTRSPCTLQVTFCKTSYHFSFKQISFNFTVAHFCFLKLVYVFTLILPSTAVTAANISSLELLIKVLTNMYR